MTLLQSITNVTMGWKCLKGYHGTYFGLKDLMVQGEGSIQLKALSIQYNNNCGNINIGFPILQGSATERAAQRLREIVHEQTFKMTFNVRGEICMRTSGVARNILSPEGSQTFYTATEEGASAG